MVQKIAFTLYPVTDMARARRFYAQGLGLVESENWDNHWVEYEAGGTVLALCDQMEGVTPSDKGGGCIAFEVADVDATVARLREFGAKVKTEPETGSVCRMATLIDSEGNALFIHHVTE